MIAGRDEVARPVNSQMGRKDNRGPYSSDNVECATKEQKQKSQLLPMPPLLAFSPEKRAEAAKKAGLSRRGEKHWRLPVNCGPAILSRMSTKSRETIYGAAQNRYLWCHDLVLQPPVGDRSFGLDQLARGARRDNPASYRLPLGNQRASPCS
jgi:hypothetical protein